MGIFHSPPPPPPNLQGPRRHWAVAVSHSLTDVRRETTAVGGTRARDGVVGRASCACHEDPALPGDVLLKLQRSAGNRPLVTGIWASGMEGDQGTVLKGKMERLREKKRRSRGNEKVGDGWRGGGDVRSKRQNERIL